MAKTPDIAEQKWMVTTDPYFNRFPRAVTPKLYGVSREELEAHLADAQHLERRGRNIVIKK